MFSGKGNALKGANPPIDELELDVLEVEELDVLEVLLVLEVLEVELVLELEVELVLDELVLEVLVLEVELKIGAPNWPRPSVDCGTLELTLKLKSTPTDSKKSSSTVMNRHSTVTCKSCNRRSCCNRSRISSCTFCVCRMTRLNVDSKVVIEPGPPASSQDSGSMVDMIRCLTESKSG